MPEHALFASPSEASSVQEQEPFYSNEDIGVLHSVIAAAQEQLNQTPGPKPLPAAALFKAYDEILPKHGIDPDADSHLSALVFRVGGEQGPGTLSQKFQAILERMNIFLEFGDDSSLSLEKESPRSRSSSSVASEPIPLCEYHRQQAALGNIALDKDGLPIVNDVPDAPETYPQISPQMSPQVAPQVAPEVPSRFAPLMAAQLAPQLAPPRSGFAARGGSDADEESDLDVDEVVTESSFKENTELSPSPKRPAPYMSHIPVHQEADLSTVGSVGSDVNEDEMQRILARIPAHIRNSQFGKAETSDLDVDEVVTISSFKENTELTPSPKRPSPERPSPERPPPESPVPYMPYMSRRPVRQEVNLTTVGNDIGGDELHPVVAPIPPHIRNSPLAKEGIKMDTPKALPKLKRNALASALDKWRGAMKNSQVLHNAKPQPVPPSPPQAQPSPQAVDEQYQFSPAVSPLQSQQEVKEQWPLYERPSENDRPLRNDRSSIVGPLLHHQQSPLNSSAPHVVAARHTEPNRPTLAQRFPPKTPSADRAREMKTATHSDAAAVAAEKERQEQQLLLNRAARAREIFLASKVFNHWADRTATRLEREGLARRHMIRFRCFQGWSQAPSSRVPAVDHLRTVTAVQKLRRAVAYQEEQLSMAAAEIARNYRHRTLLRVFDKWSCHLMVEQARQKAAIRVKKDALSTWSSRAVRDTTLQQAMLQRKMANDQFAALSSWQQQARPAGRRLQAAREVGMLRVTYDHLGEWSYRAEIERRAKAYREKLYLEKAANFFLRWGAMMRAKLHTFKTEYFTIKRNLRAWMGQAREGKVANEIAGNNFHSHSIDKFFGVLDKSRCQEAQLTRLHSRARLFIVATSILPVMDTAVEKRKKRNKEILRRYLMKRYTEVSSARKKRNFFAALDKWRALTAGLNQEADIADALAATHELSRVYGIVHKWAKKAEDHSSLRGMTQRYHRQAWLSAWSDNAREDEERGMQAWQAWAMDKQRRCLKEWSKSSLQHSGQAHTASRVQQRFWSEKRNRTFEQWKQSFEAARTDKPQPSTRNTPMPGASVLRSGWKTLSSRRYLLSERLRNQDVATGTVNTPTRWTGLPFPMSLAQSTRPMPPVKESDEESVLSSSGGDSGGVELPSYASRPRARPAAKPPSTTPGAPVPLRLHLGTTYLQAERTENRFRRSTTLGSVRARSGSPAKVNPPAARGTAAVLQPRNELRGSTQRPAHPRLGRQLEESRNVNFAPAGQGLHQTTNRQFRPAPFAANRGSAAKVTPAASYRTPMAQSYPRRNQPGSLGAWAAGRRERPV